MHVVAEKVVLLLGNKTNNMKTDKKENKYKTFLGYQRRIQEIEKKLRTLPLKKLDTPFQKGWLVYFDIREDIKSRKDYIYIKEAFDLTYKDNYHFEKDAKHITMIRSGLQSYKKQGKLISFCPIRKSISKVVFESLKPETQKYFYLDTLSHVYEKYKQEFYFLYLPKYFLVLKTKKNIMTHYIEKGGELEKERDYLKDLFHSVDNPLFTNYGKSYPKSKMRTETRDKIQKFKKGEIEDIIISKPFMDYEY